MKNLIAAGVLLALTQSALASECQNTSINKQPLFNTSQPGGSPVITGEIAGLGVSTSNQGFHRVSDSRFMNCAVGGGTMERLARSNDAKWDQVRSKCPSRNNVTALLVDVVNAGDSRLSEAAFQSKLAADAQQAIANARTVFPNVERVYLSSIVYMGYSANTGKIGEPRGWLAGAAAQDVINTGVAEWGVYTWANGTTPRGDNLVWNCSDFQSDGHHLATSGQIKVADMIDAWLAGNGNPSPPPPPPPPSGDSWCPDVLPPQVRACVDNERHGEKAKLVDGTIILGDPSDPNDRLEDYLP